MPEVDDRDRADALALAIMDTLWDNGHLWTCQGARQTYSFDCNDDDCKRLRRALLDAGYDVIELLNKNKETNQ